MAREIGFERLKDLEAAYQQGLKEGRLSAIDEAIEVVKGWHATREDIVEALEALKKG